MKVEEMYVFAGLGPISPSISAWLTLLVLNISLKLLNPGLREVEMDSLVVFDKFYAWHPQHLKNVTLPCK